MFHSLVYLLFYNYLKITTFFDHFYFKALSANPKLCAKAAPIIKPNTVIQASESPWLANIVCLIGHPPSNTEHKPTKVIPKKFQI